MSAIDAGEISEIIIERLHGDRTIRLPMQDNKIILVGANGLGKTTIVGICHAFLSQDFRELGKYNFHSILVRTSETEFSLRYDELQPGIAARDDLLRELRRVLPDHYLADDDPRVLEMFTAGNEQEIEGFVRYYTRYSGTSAVGLRRVLSRLRKRHEDLDKQISVFDRGKILDLGRRLGQAFPLQFLYFPTYRRIEKDLSSLFPNDRSGRPVFSRGIQYAQRGSHVHLVNFGMEDVELSFKRALEELETKTREELQGLAGSYLSDVIRDAPSNLPADIPSGWSEDLVERVLRRVPDEALSASDRGRLKVVIDEIRSTGHLKEQQHRYVAHYFSKLVTIHQTLLEKEKALHQAEKVCNRYLEDKEIVFDDQTYSVNVVLRDSKKVIALADLSSGEKQVVSLFILLELGLRRPFGVIIDEPELSLSVPWQQTLLPDVVGFEGCRLLIAATHSPFVFDNALDKYAVDLRSCIVREEMG